MHPARLVTVLAALAIGGCSQNEHHRVDYQALAAETPWKIEQNGSETRSIPLGGGVIRHQDRKDGKVYNLDMDESGLGAVGCVWELYVQIRTDMEICHKEDIEWKTLMSNAINDINSFIVDNSIDDTTRNYLDAVLSDKMSAINKVAASAPKEFIEKACSWNTSMRMLSHLKENGPAEFNYSVRKLLSVPRPPVSMPCL